MRDSEARRNAYVCRKCVGVIVTVDRDEGVTPMFLRCRATKDCTGQMVSCMYRVNEVMKIPPEPTWEWYAPNHAERRKLTPEMLDHVEKGGLLIREIQP
jgi:hypothetical protein